MVDFNYPADATNLGDAGPNTRMYRYHDTDADVYVYVAVQQDVSGGVGLDVIPAADTTL